MAAPLLLRDQLLGVLYLDNSLVKGAFTDDDLDILAALANQITVSQEMARVAQIESRLNNKYGEV